MKLYFVNGPEAGHIREAAERIGIGRETDNDISILSGGLSRYHAVAEKGSAGWTLKDLQSTNGTKVNGKAISPEIPQPLHNGDLCTLGDQVFRVEIDPAETLPAPVPEPVEAPGVMINLLQQETPAVPPVPEVCPIPVPAVVPPPLPAQIPVIPPPQVMNNFSGQSLFGGKKEAGEAEGEGGEEKCGSRLGNVIFVALLLVAVLIIGVMVYLSLGVGEGKGNAGKHQAIPLLPTTVMFERQRAENGNVFRFSFRLEQGRYARAKITDVVSGISHDSNLVPVFPEDPKMADMPPWPERKKALLRLEEAIRASQLMSLQIPPQAPSDIPDYYRLSVCCGNEFKKVDEYSNNPPAAVYALEEAIRSFTNDVLKIAISKPPQEAKEDAENFFTLGKELYDNREANPENLKKAIRFFTMTQATLTLFNPKPAVYVQARKLSADAKAFKDERIQLLKADANQAFGLRNFQRALKDQEDMLRYLDEEYDAEEVKKCRENVANLQHLISGQK